MSIDDDPSSNEMQSSNPAHLESYLKGLFEIPSQNIEAAFQLVLDLIKQQSGEIDELKKAYQEATSRNDELSVQIERTSNDIAKERVDVATTLDDLKRDRDQLLASQEKTQATIVSIQQEIKSLQFYIHGISVDENVVENDNKDLSISSDGNLVGNDSSQDSFVHVHPSVGQNSSLDDPTGAEHDLSTDRHSVTSVYVAGDSDVISSSTSQSSQSKGEQLVEPNNDFVGDDSSARCASELSGALDHDEQRSSSSIPMPKTLRSSSDGQGSGSKQTVKEQPSINPSPEMPSTGKESDVKRVQEDNFGKVMQANYLEQLENTCYTNSSTSKTPEVTTEVLPLAGPSKQTTATGIHRDSGLNNAKKLENADIHTSASTPNTKQMTEVVADKETMPHVGSGRMKAKNIFKKVVNSRMIAADQTVTARLSRLERSLFGLMKQLPAKSTEGAPVEDMVTSLESRLNTVENFLHGFEDRDNTDNAKNSEVESDAIECESRCSEEYLDEQTGNAVSRDSDGAESDVEATGGLQKVQSLVFHLNERDNKTQSSIEGLEKQIANLQETIGGGERSSDSYGDNLALEVETAVCKLSEDLKQKVSNQDFLREIESIREALESYSSRQQCKPAEQQTEEEGRLGIRLNEMIMRINEIETLKLDKDKFDEVMHQKDISFQSLIDDEISKHRLRAADGSEVLANELKTLRAIVDSQIGSGAHRDDSVNQTSSDDKQIGLSDVDDLIQQATNSVRESLEGSFAKKLNELRCIENEIDGLVSQLAEKPSQDQIDSMLQGIEASMSERIGQDRELQLMMKSIKDELSQRMTRSEVVNLVKAILKKAKLDIQNTKNTLMIGRIPYKCIGCNEIFPAGVNGLRASKVNHDSLSTRGSFNAPRVLHSASGRSLRPLRTPVRPSTASIGGGLGCRHSLRTRNNSR